MDLAKIAKQAQKQAKNQPPRPPNVFTTREYGAQVGIGRDAAIHQLRPLIESGQIRPTKMKIVDISGRAGQVSAWEVVSHESK